MTLRPCRPEDVDAVYALAVELAEYERLRHMVTGTAAMLGESLFGPVPAAECLVSEVGGTVVGYALSFPNFSTFRMQAGTWLEDIYVTPAHRGTGIGKALLTAVVDAARARGRGRVEWAVLDWNQSAIDFYERFGATMLPEWRICRVSL